MIENIFEVLYHWFNMCACVYFDNDKCTFIVLYLFGGPYAKTDLLNDVL